jgi:hypothetical protein
VVVVERVKLTLRAAAVREEVALTAEGTLPAPLHLVGKVMLAAMAALQIYPVGVVVVLEG